MIDSTTLRTKIDLVVVTTRASTQCRCCEHSFEVVQLYESEFAIEPNGASSGVSYAGHMD
jgi:hypothetical protein